MGMFLDFVINKSGKNLPVYDITENKKIGEIYNRESFILYGGEGSSVSIKFLNPQGAFATAIIDIDSELFKTATVCTDYPYGTANIDGKEYKTFIMRQSKTIYHGDGSRWGTVAQNMLVATNNPDVGGSHPDWKEISYVMQSPNRNWVKVDGKGYNHGYVDTGISKASGYSKIPFYGSW